MSEDLKKQYIRAGFQYDYCDEDEQGDNKLERVERMVQDMILSSCKFREGQVVNFLVLAKISEEQMVYVLEIMKLRGHNAVFARKWQSQEEDGDSSLIGRLSESGISEWTCPPNLLDETFEDESLKWW
ncbi:unnamed protein product [Microthlaspi erraticum]|uniref:Uncharacterized protein n=1 Tax=Microthlaspi erraticum TaxID=1685480 RepID=A0A6D2I579_9BRAS|nr:unnamed protein product [Microthlaspi erraticum]